MKYVDFCTACGSKNIIKTPASISNFVVDRMTGAKIKSNFFYPCEGITCKECGVITTSIRFDRNEEESYYFDYGESHYVNHRAIYEGEGIKRIFEYYKSDVYFFKRKLGTANFLKQHLNFQDVKTLLDLGGGTGVMIPDEFDQTKKFVLDSSKKQPVKGVKLITDISEIEPVEFLFCAHTLEHVSYPKEFLDFLMTCVQQNGWVYIEVPNEGRDNIANNNFHEHINLFTMHSLKKLLSNYLNIVGEVYLDNKEVIAILGKKK